MNYPRPQNDSAIGVHASPNASFPIGRGDELARNTVADWKQQGISWAKLLVFLGEHSHEQEFAVDECVRNDIQVVLRLFVDKPYPGNTTPEFYAKVRESVIYWRARGVHYVEIRNEPNLRDAEWESDAAWHAYGSLEGRAHHAAQLFIQDAQVIIAAGGIPLTPALAPGGHDDDERVWREICAYWKAQGVHDLLRQCGIAAHCYTLNHPPTYPYDAINQAEWPGAHLWSGGQSNGFLKYRYAAKMFRDAMGFTIPVLSTEDGPLMWNRDDGRYPQIDEQVHQKYILEIADFMHQQAEDDFLCTAFWLYGSRLFEAHGSPPPWEKDSWVSPYGSSLPNRSGVELPVVASLKARGYKPRKKGVKWEWEGTSVPIIWGDQRTDRWRTLCEKYAALKNLDPRIVGTVLALESAGNPSAVSSAGAVGLMQVMPHEKIPGRPTAAQLLDPDLNVKWGVQILADGTRAFGGSLAHGLAAYYMGVGGVQAKGLQHPDAQKYLTTFARVWRELWPGQAVPGDVVQHIGETPQPPPALDPSLARAAAFAALGIALNPQSAFYKEARRRALGRPVTGEIDLDNYRIQGFDKAILAARLFIENGVVVGGDWDNMQVVEWLG